MHALLIHDLPYLEDSTVYFALIKDQPWAILLDSGQPVSQYGRYDIMVAKPFVTIKTIELQAQVLGSQAADDNPIVTEINQHGQVTHSGEDPFLVLNRLLLPYLPKAQATTLLNLPFVGGAVGYFAYDLARQVEQLPSIAQKNQSIAHMMVGIYDWALIVDHREKTAQLVSMGFEASTLEAWPRLCTLFEGAASYTSVAIQAPLDFKVNSPITSNMTMAQYAAKFNAIKRYIIEGDCYQVNLAQRFSAKATGDAWQAYLKLREMSPAPFMAYMNYGNLQVLSGSPERFLQVVNRHVETRPIKGTRPRDADAKHDQQQAHELKNSSKDRAEKFNDCRSFA